MFGKEQRIEKARKRLLERHHKVEDEREERFCERMESHRKVTPETSSDMDYLHEVCQSDMKQIVAMKTFMEEMGVLQAWETCKGIYLEDGE